MGIVFAGTCRKGENVLKTASTKLDGWSYGEMKTSTDSEHVMLVCNIHRVCRSFSSPAMRLFSMFTGDFPLQVFNDSAHLDYTRKQQKH